MKIKTQILAVLILVASSLSAQPNLVPNPQFELNRPSSAEYEFQNPQMDKNEKTCKDFGNPLFRYSPAQNWAIWLGSVDCKNGVMTELVKAASNCVQNWPNFVMGNMMHVKTTGSGMGIQNVDIPAGTNAVKISCWVYVIKGKVDFAFGPTGSRITGATAYSSAICKWERLEIIKKGKEAGNQITLFAKDKDAEFYVDAVSVVKM
jgi:hypothetical protein